MKLVMTLLVRDLADIVAANIEYHLAQGVDHIIVTDNGSVDATRSIVARYAATGRVTLIDEARDDYDQAAWVTRMAREAWRMGADWVINDDCDELWWPLRGDLKSTLELVPPEYGSVLVARTNMMPIRQDGGHPFERMVFRDMRDVNGLGRPLQRKAAHRAAPDVEVDPGNHAARGTGLGPSLALDDILIFHYPHRSYEQMRRKIELGGPAVARNTRVSESTFDVWRALHRLLLGGRLREWYDGLPHGDDGDIAERLASGAAVRDERIARFVRENIGPALDAPSAS